VGYISVFQEVDMNIAMGIVFAGLLVCFIGRLIADILAIKERNKHQPQY
jgi:ABC-type dipeptide/oligopeptide/nickel transport system permease component